VRAKERREGLKAEADSLFPPDTSSLTVDVKGKRLANPQFKPGRRFALFRGANLYAQAAPPRHLDAADPNVCNAAPVRRRHGA
jgi:hypothetical protein